MMTEERDRYLRTLASCGRRLNALASDTTGLAPAAQDLLLTKYVQGVVLAAVGLAKDDLRSQLVSWLQDQVRDDFQLCTLCGKPRDPGALACRDCIKLTDDVERELGLTELLKDILAPDPPGPDPRD